MLICINGDKMNQWEYSDQYLDNFNSTRKQIFTQYVPRSLVIKMPPKLPV